ncbi:MAG: sulfite exporter TauE/SafE family protein [Ignavibacteriales bacterium]|nr:sulfite exporter TauE/SafE family protein [Ignavibacteriales bacterium]
MQSNETVIPFSRILRWYFLFLTGLAILSMLLFLTFRMFASDPFYDHVLGSVLTFVDGEFITYVGIGFLAQMIDGALGMAYGVSSTSFLMSVGVSPAVASASVHAAEVVTSGLSGLSHWKFGNVTKDLFYRLALPGAIGAAAGAYILTSIDGDQIKPYVSAYLLLMGIVILAKAMRKSFASKPFKRLRLLALFGGFVDASGGGGWGPVVTSTLIGSGRSPRFTIGTVNAVEFIVAATATGIFSVFVGLESWNVILGLIMGGAFAAPLGAYFCSKVKVRTLMTLVGVLIVALSIRTIIKSFGLM